MDYEVNANGRVRHVTVHRQDGRFVVAIDGREWMVDAARIDSQTLSLLIAKKGSGGFSAPDESGISAKIQARGSPSSPAENPPDPFSNCSHEVTLAADPRSGGFCVQVAGTSVEVSFAGRRGRGPSKSAADAGSGPQRVVAPMPGKIVRVLVKQGEAVTGRQPLVVIEAMKMENELRAGSDGRVAEIHVRDGQSVEAGALLAVIHR